MPIRVIIVDDSAVVRKVLTRELARDDEIEIVATAPDPFIARNKIVKYEPDVVTLDIEMPRMDGITFLKRLMHYHPIPTIVVSSMTPKGGARALEAMEAGAVDVLAKPGPADTVGLLGMELIDKIKAAARIELRGKPTPAQPAAPMETRSRTVARDDMVIAIGASTGGTVAIQGILMVMPKESPPLVIVQHMPEYFTRAYADRVDDLCAIHVKEAENGEPLVGGTAYIAPGGRHMLVKKARSRHKILVKEGPRVRRHRPSVDVLFKSVASACGPKAIGILLTGMGSDGALGMQSIKEAGASTIAQDEQTSAIFGMPREAIKLGVVDETLPLDEIPRAILDLLEESA